MRLFVLTLALIVALTSQASAGPTLPQDVKDCMKRGRLWLAQPEFVEAITVDLGKGRPTRAYQILDRLDGLEGHILVVPGSCRVVVLVLRGSAKLLEKSDPSLSLYGRVDLSAARAPSRRERELLYSWAQLAALDRKRAAHGLAAALHDPVALHGPSFIDEGMAGAKNLRPLHFYRGQAPAQRRAYVSPGRKGVLLADRAKPKPVDLDGGSLDAVKVDYWSADPNGAGWLAITRNVGSDAVEHVWVGPLIFRGPKREVLVRSRFAWWLEPDGAQGQVNLGGFDLQHGRHFRITIGVPVQQELLPGSPAPALVARVQVEFARR